MIHKQVCVLTVTNSNDQGNMPGTAASVPYVHSLGLPNSSLSSCHDSGSLRMALLEFRDCLICPNLPRRFKGRSQEMNSGSLPSGQ